jgi:multidrug resistance efflux pump
MMRQQHGAGTTSRTTTRPSLFEVNTSAGLRGVARTIGLAGVVGVVGAAGLVGALGVAGLAGGCESVAATGRGGEQGKRADAQAGGQAERDGSVRLRGRVVIAPEWRRAVSARHPGVLTALAVQEGDSVRQGDLLGEVDSPTMAGLIANLRRLEAEWGEARLRAGQADARAASLNLAAGAKSAAADVAEEEMLRLRTGDDEEDPDRLNEVRIRAILLRHEAQVVQSDLEQARRDAAVAREQVSALLRTAQALREQIGPDVQVPGTQGAWASDQQRPHITRLLSPMDGVVTAVRAVVGGGVQGGEALVELASVASVLVEADVPEGLLNTLGESQGWSAEVRAEGRANVARGVCRGLRPEPIGPERRVAVRAIIENDGGALRPGMIVELVLKPAGTGGAAGTNEPAATGGKP